MLQLVGAHLLGSSQHQQSRPGVCEAPEHKRSLNKEHRLTEVDLHDHYHSSMISSDERELRSVQGESLLRSFADLLLKESTSSSVDRKQEWGGS